MQLKPDIPTVNTVIISDDKQINDNVCNHKHYNGTVVYVLLQVMKGEGDKWINEVAIYKLYRYI